MHFCVVQPRTVQLKYLPQVYPLFRLTSTEHRRLR